MIIERKIIFKKTPLDIPLILFLVSQFLSTIISIDKRTSIFGYYSRFHGGFLSSLSYALCYWVFVSNMDKINTLKSIKVLLSSGIIISIWAILEHFGKSFSCLLFPGFNTFDTSCWIQDVQNRVFATLGQPNWLAAWITATIPILWAFALNSRIKSKNFLLLIFIFSAYFLSLIFTKSRSGLLAFLGSDIVFSGIILLGFLKQKIFPKEILLKLFIFNALAFLVILIFGTPWTPTLSQMLSQKVQETPDSQKAPTQPLLETGGTDSGKIRKIVWKGAIEIWKNYPILGSGVETFAFSYYKFRPSEHNLVSEWEYLYNKAHNEYLNFAATTGSFGLLSYLFLVGASIATFVRKGNEGLKKINKTLKSFPSTKEFRSFVLTLGFLSGYTSILITNFFGFSVVAVALLFFLFPAFSVSGSDSEKQFTQGKGNKGSLSLGQILLIFIIFSATLWILIAISKYWYADYLYAQSKLQNDSGNFTKAREILSKAITLSPYEAIFWDELANSTTNIALLFFENDNKELANAYKNQAIAQTEKAIALSPFNVILKKSRANYLIKLSTIDPNLLTLALETFKEASELAPTDAKLYYNLSVAYLRAGDYTNAIKTMEKTIELKPDYKDARFGLALMYQDVGEKEKAREQLKYILENINPQDTFAKRELDELGD